LSIETTTSDFPVICHVSVLLYALRPLRIPNHFPHRHVETFTEALQGRELHILLAPFDGDPLTRPKLAKLLICILIEINDPLLTLRDPSYLPHSSQVSVGHPKLKSVA
jgi:hypothetical protein